MTTITYYRQARRDGCIRTGIEIDKQVLFGQFEGETEDFDPILTWFVDVECTGEGLPGQPEAIRRWLLDHARPIRGGLESVAEEIGPGLDLQLGLQREFPIDPGGVTLAVYCRANRRFEAQQMAEIVRDTARHWESRIQNLPAVEPVTF